MTKNKKIKFQGYGFALGAAQRDSKDIRLLNISSNNITKSATYITIDQLENGQVEKITDMPDDNIFFYKIEQYQKTPKARTLEILEEGMGFIKSVDGKRFIERESTFKTFTPDDGELPHASSKLFSSFDPQKILIITTTIPHSHRFMYASENSVVCSSAPFIPNPVRLEENTVLGNINGDIQAISGSKLGQVLGKEGFLSSFVSSSSPLITNSSKFDLAGKDSLFISNSLLLKSTRGRPKNALPGQLIYNSRKKCFEGYDGSKWRPLKWGDK